MKIPHDDVTLETEKFDEGLERLVQKTQEDSFQHSQLHSLCDSVMSIVAYIPFFWIYYRTEFILGIILICLIALATTGVIEAFEHGKNINPKKHQIATDYSDIESALELKLGKIDHWCLDGGDDKCSKCVDPTMPSSRIGAPGWRSAYKRNMELSANFLEKNPLGIDVIFLGDSNTEARSGSFQGSSNKVDDNTDTSLKQIKKKFDKLFKRSDGGDFNGLALGIAGDSSPNLLWRIQNDEFQNLKPNVWWISIGANDLLATHCSEEITLMGVLRVVEELLSRKDGAIVVINSILPVAVRANLLLEGKSAHNKYWYSIKQVNERLHKFAKKHSLVKYFKADDILTETRGRDLYMKKEMFLDKFHLSPSGQNALAVAQVSTIHSILKGPDTPEVSQDEESIIDYEFDDFVNYYWDGDDFNVDDWYDGFNP